MPKTISLEEARVRTVEELLNEVADSHETMRVTLAEGREIEITPVPKLKPLTRLEGSVPAGWKDAIYGEK
jgi:hypothetical protein